MKKKGKHIRSLKVLVEFIVNYISIIGLAVFLFLILLHINQVSSLGINILNKINTILGDEIEPQNYQIVYSALLKCTSATASVIISIFFDKPISIVAKKKKYTIRLKRYIYYKLRKCYGISDKWITHTIIPKLINVFLHGKPLNCYCPPKLTCF